MKTLQRAISNAIGILLLVQSYSFAQQSTKATDIADSFILKLENKVKVIDTYALKHFKDLIIWVKLPEKTKLIKVKSEHWPEEVEYTYNILKDSSGRILVISQIPFSESGDWYITYTHYFDEKGNTYAFRKQTNVFDSEVKGGVIYETLLKYYDENFNILKKTYKLQDKSGKTIKNNGHLNIYQYKYQIYKSLGVCLKGYHLMGVN